MQGQNASISSPTHLSSRVSSGSSLTPFQRRVYQALQQIPRGKVTTYKILADYLSAADGLSGSGRRRSCRAVGQALKRNPFAPKIPCHRVIASDLTIGGYQGHRTGKAIRRKLRLIRDEGVLFRKGKLANPDLIYQFKQDQQSEAIPARRQAGLHRPLFGPEACYGKI